MYYDQCLGDLFNSSRQQTNDPADKVRSYGNYPGSADHDTLSHMHFVYQGYHGCSARGLCEEKLEIKAVGTLKQRRRTLAMDRRRFLHKGRLLYMKVYFRDRKQLWPFNT